MGGVAGWDRRGGDGGRGFRKGLSWPRKSGGMLYGGRKRRERGRTQVN